MKKYLKLFTGMFLCALGCVMIIKADFGSAPWDVLHQGISKTIGVTIGQASITLGIFIVLLDIFLGQPIGIGTVLNFLSIGIFISCRDIFLCLWNFFVYGTGNGMWSKRWIYANSY